MKSETKNRSGICTGYRDRVSTDWAAHLDYASKYPSVELSALEYSQMVSLVKWLPDNAIKGFDHVSIHGPVKNVVNRDVLSLVTAAAPYVDHIVMHPDTLSNIESYADLGDSIVLENMDIRKSYGTTVDDMKEIFTALPEAGFCLDIAHSYTIDPTMELADQLLVLFANRLKEIHISSIRNGKHCPLLPEDRALFADYLEADVPIIYEAYHLHA